MALCYNFSRLLSILGIDSFMAYLASRLPHLTLLLIIGAITGIITRLWALPASIRAQIRPTFQLAV
jgi:hypothetical protein